MSNLFTQENLLAAAFAFLVVSSTHSAQADDKKPEKKTVKKDDKKGAGDVAEIFPNIVSPGDSNESQYNAVNYVELIPVMVRGMQQQQRIMKKQQQEIAAQKIMIEELSAIVKKN